MRILHVLTAPRAEGTPRLVLDWVTVREHEQDILFLSESGELKEAFDSLDNWTYYNTAFPPRLKHALDIVRLTERVCKERKPDLVIAWMTGFSHWVHAGARLAGVRQLIVHAGNPPGDGFMARYVWSYVCFWPGRLFGNKVIACSAYTMRQFLAIPGLSPRQFFAVYNCVNLEKFEKPNKPPSNTAIMVATLQRHKDHITLLRAWQHVEQANPNLMLKLAGDGQLREELVELQQSLGLRNVTFLGSRKDVPELLRESSVFVLSTTTKEGFGTVLIEALAAGCRVVASDVPACREVLADGRYGTLVEPRNPEKLADALLREFSECESQAQQAERLGYARQFTPAHMVEQYLAIAGASVDKRQAPG